MGGNVARYRATTEGRETTKWAKARGAQTATLSRPSVYIHVLRAPLQTTCKHLTPSLASETDPPLINLGLDTLGNTSRLQVAASGFNDGPPPRAIGRDFFFVFLFFFLSLCLSSGRAWPPSIFLTPFLAQGNSPFIH